MVSSWLITGGCGFLGTSLIKHLLTDKLAKHIRVLDNLSVGTEMDLAKVCDYTLVKRQSNLVQLVVGDIKDFETCKSCAKDIDIIVHLAANTGVFPSVQDPRSDMESNVVGTFNMLEAARVNGVKRFIFASSGAPVGECSPPIHEELPCHPVSPYGASKLAGEAYCSAYFKTFGIETVALRFGNVYGPGSGHKNSVVAKFIKQAIKRETLEIYGDGSQTRDFIFIDDLIEAIYRAAALGPHSYESFSLGGEIFQIATNKETTVAEMTEQLITALEENGITGFKVINGEKRKGDVMRNFSDTTKADKRLGWNCTTTLREGLVKTIQYFLSTSSEDLNES